MDQDRGRIDERIEHLNERTNDGGLSTTIPFERLFSYQSLTEYKYAK